MTCILNVQEAFNALQTGKTVLCRYAGDGTLPGDKEFSPLDHMPATVFVMPHYEFCIKLEMIELAGISFTKPLKLDEYQDGQEVYVICTYAPSIYVMNFKTNALVESINSGFVQRDAENAKLQLTAICKMLGCEFSDDVSVTRLGNEPKKTKRKKEPEDKITAIDDDVEETLSSEFVKPESEESNSNDNHQKILNDLIDQASKAQSSAEANSVFQHTKGWTQEQSAPLHAAVSRRLSELPQPEIKEPPSLLVRIQNASDLTELNALELEISGRDQLIQKDLMDEVKKRRAQIKQFELDFAEDLP